MITRTSDRSEYLRGPCFVSLDRREWATLSPQLVCQISWIHAFSPEKKSPSPHPAAHQKRQRERIFATYTAHFQRLRRRRGGLPRDTLVDVRETPTPESTSSDLRAEFFPQTSLLDGILPAPLRGPLIDPRPPVHALSVLPRLAVTNGPGPTSCRVLDDRGGVSVVEEVDKLASRAHWVLDATLLAKGIAEQQERVKCLETAATSELSPRITYTEADFRAQNVSRVRCVTSLSSQHEVMDCRTSMKNSSARYQCSSQATRAR